MQPQKQGCFHYLFDGIYAHQTHQSFLEVQSLNKRLSKNQPHYVSLNSIKPRKNNQLFKTNQRQTLFQNKNKNYKQDLINKFISNRANNSANQTGNLSARSDTIKLGQRSIKQIVKKEVSNNQKDNDFDKIIHPKLIRFNSSPARQCKFFQNDQQGKEKLQNPEILKTQKIIFLQKNKYRGYFQNQLNQSHHKKNNKSESFNNKGQQDYIMTKNINQAINKKMNGLNSPQFIKNQQSGVNEDSKNNIKGEQNKIKNNFEQKKSESLGSLKIKQKIVVEVLNKQHNKVLNKQHNKQHNKISMIKMTSSNFGSLDSQNPKLKKYFSEEEKHNIKNNHDFHHKTGFKEIRMIKFMGSGRFFSNKLSVLNIIGFIYLCKHITTFTLRYNDLEYKIMKSLEINSRITHPNILRVFYSFQNQHQLSIAVEYGQSNLSTEIQQNGGRIFEKRAVTILRSILSGLSYLHNYSGDGFLHSAVKPKNIIMVNNIPKLEWLGYQDSIVSPFVSPQIKRGSPPTKKTDIWSVGMIAYLMIFGQVFPKNQTITLQYLNSQQKIKNIFISSQYKNFIIKCLSQNQTTRMNTAQSIAHPLFKQINTIFDSEEIQ